ncbi:hypothetical protein [Haladaptatus sp. CMSO5]|uniref:hypothetical protein n=1 Tax=Haladaptatus sp. CMSO5 TaxID=3120514 RepID=UPI002FCE47A2
MGRTNPTYRQFLRRYETRMAPFRRALRADAQPQFDRLLARAEEYADAASYLNAPDPERAIIFSMLLSQERELAALRRDLDALRDHHTHSDSER